MIEPMPPRLVSNAASLNSNGTPPLRPRHDGCAKADLGDVPAGCPEGRPPFLRRASHGGSPEPHRRDYSSAVEWSDWSSFNGLTARTTPSHGIRNLRDPVRRAPATRRRIP